MTAMFPGQIGTARLLVWVLMCAIVLKIFGACLLQWENRCYIDNLSSLNPEMGHPFQSSELFFPREGLNESLMVYLFRVSHWKHDHLSGVEGCFVLMLKSFFKYMQNQFFVVNKAIEHSASQIFPMVTDEEISCTIEQVFYLWVDPNRRFQPEKKR